MVVTVAWGVYQFLSLSTINYTTVMKIICRCHHLVGNSHSDNMFKLRLQMYNVNGVHCDTLLTVTDGYLWLLLVEVVDSGHCQF